MGVGAVERHDEVVAGAGAGDVQQADALVVVELLVEGERVVVAAVVMPLPAFTS